MITTQKRVWSIGSLVVAAILLLTLAVSQVGATTFNTPTVDGVVNVPDANDWDADELIGASGGITPARNLYLTWDDTYLYIGVTGASRGAAVLYIDTAEGGQQTGFYPGNFMVANGPNGYEFAWGVKSTGAVEWYDGRGGSWALTALPAGATFSRGADLEVRIPWSGLTGYTPGGRLSVLVANGVSFKGIERYWPNDPGNTITPGPSFTKSKVFPGGGTSGVPPGGAPTAVGLQAAAAAPAVMPALNVAGFLLLALVTAGLIWRRRSAG